MTKNKNNIVHLIQNIYFDGAPYLIRLTFQREKFKKTFEIHTNYSF